MTEHWTATLTELENLDIGPETSNLKELFAQEKEFLDQCVQDIDERSAAALVHATASRVTVPPGVRSRPSVSSRPEYIAKEGCKHTEQQGEGESEQGKEQEQEQKQGEGELDEVDREPEEGNDKTPERRGSGGGWVRSWFGQTPKTSDTPEGKPTTSTSTSTSAPAPSVSSGTSASPVVTEHAGSRHQKENNDCPEQGCLDSKDNNNEESDEEEDTPMNRAYKERLRKEVQAVEEAERRSSAIASGSLEDSFAKEYFAPSGTTSSTNRRRAVQQAVGGGGHPRRLKPTSSHTKATTTTTNTPTATPIPPDTHITGSVDPPQFSSDSNPPPSDLPSSFTSHLCEEIDNSPADLLPSNTNNRNRSRSNAPNPAVSESRNRRNTVDSLPPDSLPDFDIPHTHRPLHQLLFLKAGRR